MIEVQYTLENVEGNEIGWLSGSWILEVLEYQTRMLELKFVTRHKRLLSRSFISFEILFSGQHYKIRTGKAGN